ncbi:MAG: Lrp/AsnC family transcriptional regulator [Thermoplasmata archaeon]
MDPLDFAIYRYLSRGGEARFWAGRRIIDPLMRPREIAERVGISESGVRARLVHLVDRGYLASKIVLPNPSLFGSQVYVANLLIKDPGEVDRILRDLALAERVIFTRDVLDEDERKIRVHFLAENDSTASRYAALIGRLSPEGNPLMPLPYYIPACDRDLSSLEWKVLEEIWRRPDATPAEIAEGVRISQKTAARTYHQLIDSRACWWTHGPTSEEFPLALVRVDLRKPMDRDQITRWIVKEAPSWLPVASDGLGLAPEDMAGVVAGLVPADAPTGLERFVRRFARVEGVARIRRTFPLGSSSYPTWFSDRFKDRER